MLKKFILIGLIILSSYGIKAQYKPILFGFRGGFNMGWIKSPNEHYTNEGMRPGGSWGFIAEFFLMENYAIMTGFDVDYIGGKLSYPDARIIGGGSNYTQGNTSRRYKIQYLEVPLVLKMQTKVANKFKAFGKIGLGTSFRWKAKANDVFTYADNSLSEKGKDIKEDISLLKQSLILGIGVEFSFYESLSMIVDLTFDNGFTDILKGSNPRNPEENRKGNLSYLQLGVGFLF